MRTDKVTDEGSYIGYSDETNRYYTLIGIKRGDEYPKGSSGVIDAHEIDRGPDATKWEVTEYRRGVVKKYLATDAEAVIYLRAIFMQGHDTPVNHGGEFAGWGREVLSPTGET